MKTASWLFYIAVLCFAFCLVSATALATSIPIDGVVFHDSSEYIDYSLSGGSLEIGYESPSHANFGTVSAPDSGFVVYLDAFNVGCCIFQYQYSASLNGVAFNSFLGTLAFSLPDGLSTTPVPLGSSLSAPIYVWGGVTLWGHYGYSGYPMVNILISGSGTLSLVDLETCGAPNVMSCSPSDAGFAYLEYDFSGTATPFTPEPASLVLLGTGMLGIGVIALKQRAREA